jgi:hypothetical protein
MTLVAAKPLTGEPFVVQMDGWMEGPDSFGEQPQGGRNEKNFECDGGVDHGLRRGGSTSEVDMGG